MKQTTGKTAPANKRTDLLTTKELCKVLNVCESTITNYVREGMPKEGYNLFKAVPVLFWYSRRVNEQRLYLRIKTREKDRDAKLQLRKEKIRKIRTQTDLLELKCETLRMNLIEKERAVNVYESSFYELRASLLSLPGKLKYIATCQTPEDFSRILSEELREILRDHDPARFSDRIR